MPRTPTKRRNPGLKIEIEISKDDKKSRSSTPKRMRKKPARKKRR